MRLSASKFYNYLISKGCQIANADIEWMTTDHFVHPGNDTEYFIRKSKRSDYINAHTIQQACEYLKVDLPTFKNLECDEE
jgi:hypothetical protein